MTALNATAVTEIRGELARRRMTQRELAAATGLGDIALNRRLRGHVPLTLPDVEAIAAALGVSPTALLDPPGRQTPTEVA
jgi:transcriptional regulator with XRE-family HTH domain